MSSGCDLHMRLTSLCNFQEARVSAFFGLSQIDHCQSADITIAEFSRIVFITVFTPFLQDLCFILHEEDKKGPIFGGCFLSAQRCDDKIPPPKTSSQPSRGGFSRQIGGIICLQFLLQPVCRFWTTASIRANRWEEDRFSCASNWPHCVRTRVSRNATPLPHYRSPGLGLVTPEKPAFAPPVPDFPVPGS